MKRGSIQLAILGAVNIADKKLTREENSRVGGWSCRENTMEFEHVKHPNTSWLVTRKTLVPFTSLTPKKVSCGAWPRLWSVS